MSYENGQSQENNSKEAVKTVKKPARRSSGKASSAEKKRGKRVKKILAPEEVEMREKAKRDENIAVGICPFYRQDRGDGRLSCEGANFHFPDKEARREYVYRLCAHPEGYKSCPLQEALEHYYERKYAKDE